MKNINIFPILSQYDSAKSGGELDIPNVSFVNEDNGVRYLLKNVLTHNGYEYVDLGLPSGNLWATCNIGATSPEQTGLYFACGETTGYTIDQVNNNERIFDEYTWSPNIQEEITSNLTLEQDAAHVNMGEGWTIPSDEDYNELLKNTTCTYTTNYNNTGISGYIYTSNNNSNSIFFPIGGYVDGSRYTDEFGNYINTISNSNEALCSTSKVDGAYFFIFNAYVDDNIDNSIQYMYRYDGYNIRGIYKN